MLIAVSKTSHSLCGSVSDESLGILQTHRIVLVEKTKVEDLTSSPEDNAITFVSRVFITHVYVNDEDLLSQMYKDPYLDAL